MTVAHTMAVYGYLYQAQLLHFVVRKKPPQKPASEQCNRQMYQFCYITVCSGNGYGNLLLLALQRPRRAVNSSTKFSGNITQHSTLERVSWKP